MRVLIVGDGHAAIHEPALANALRQAGAEVKTFFWHPYFVSEKPLQKIVFRIENKFIVGPQLNKIQSNLIEAVVKFQPEVLLVYRGTHIFPDTLERIKQLGVRIVSYNNDDPFSGRQAQWMWRHFIRGLKLSDLALAYREHNIRDFLGAGAPRCELFRSWYIPEKNRKLQLTPEEHQIWDSDIVFAGHFENDGRLSLVEALAKEPWKFNLFGPEWNTPAAQSAVLKNRIPIKVVVGEDYNKAISGSKIAVCIFSKLNRDTYTRRCFEIPASGTMMLCEHSNDMANLFEADKEVVFFKSIPELIEKAKYYLSHDEERESIAERGYQRVLKDGHDINSRAKQLMKLLANLAPLTRS